MKRRFTILTAALALLTFLAVPMGMWGQTTVDVTLSSGSFNNNVITWTCADGNITIQQLKGSGSTNPNGSYMGRVYKQNILSFVGTNGYTITNIDIKCDGSYYGTTKYAGTEISNNDVSNNTTALNPTWSTTNGGTHTIATVSSDGLSEIYIQNGHSSDANTQLRITKLTITYKVTGSVTATTVTINTSGLTNTDVYTSTTAGTLTASVTETESGDAISGATVAWSSSNTDVATIDNNGAVTLVAVGTSTITASYAGGNGYGSSSATYELTVTSSEPYVQPTTIEIVPNYEFWGKTGQFSGNTYNELDGSQDNVSLHWTRGSGSTYANSTAMRFYKDNNLTFTAPEGYEIKSIVITFSSAQYAPSDLSFTPGDYSLSETIGTWTGSSSTVTMSRPSNASSYAQISMFTITLGLPSTDPSITAENVDLAYDAEEGTINFTINNPVEGGVTTVAEDVDWISNAVVSGNAVNFSTSVNEARTARIATVTLTYTYGDNETVTKDVTVTQAGNPNATMTIAEVRAQGTGDVATKGIVTSCVGTTGYIQDATAAICVYGTSLTVGDEIRVSGTLSTYHGLLEITSPEVTVISQGNTVTPELMTIADINTTTNQGWYIRIEDATVTEINGQNTTIAQGENTIVVYGISDVEYGVNDVISLNGNIGCYNATQIANPTNVEVQAAPATPSITIAPNEVNVDANEHDGTLNLTYENLDITGMSDFDIQFFDENDNAIAGPDWMEVLVAEQDPTIGEGYVVSYMIYENEDEEAHIAYFKVWTYDENLNEVYSNLVTINQAAPVAPVTGDKYVKVTSTADLTSGQYLIVYEEGSVAFNGSLETLDAANNTIEVVLNNSTIAVDNITVASEFTIDMTAGTVKSASGYYIGQSSDANGMQTSMETAYTNSISFDNDEAIIVSSGGAHLRYNATSGQERFRYYKSSTYTSQKAIQLYKKVGDEPATETHTLTINGYQDDENEGGYALIASPVNVDPATVGMTTGDFDLYYFDESQELEWRNYEATLFNLVPGTGYLYAKKATTENQTYSFELTGTPYSGNGMVDLAYTEDAEFAGFNLIGNPFNTNATLDMPYYRLSQDGSALNTTTESSEINVMEGVFVQATAANQKANFTKVGNGTKKISQLNVKVTRNRSAVLDNAIIRFDEGATLNKFQLNANSTKLYFTEGNQDFAVVRSANEGEMPVNFKAAENGTYTISINAENVDVNYLHLIDNMTGADVDLLATPSYSFEAKVTDYASRFRLVFNANSGVNEQNSETFAFFNGNNLVINNEGEATLQVIDMMGRMISSEQINGSYSNSLNLSAGVYVLRLSNGNTVKTQKIVID